MRFFCSADDSSDLGRTALAYTEAMVSLGIPVRLVASRFAQLQTLIDGQSKGWAKFRGLFLTPIGASYVNVVCGDPWDWKRLYTVSVKNLLVTGKPPVDADELRVAMLYEHIMVPTEEISLLWQALGITPLVVPTSWAEHAATLREVLLS